MIHRGIFYRFFWAIFYRASFYRALASVGGARGGWARGPGGFEVLARLRKGVLQVEFRWRF